MAATIGARDPAVSNGAEAMVKASRVERRLMERPWEFQFFQAVRILDRSANVRPVGRFGDPRLESVWFGVHASLAFPGAAIRAIEPRPERPPLMVVNFLGLFGPAGMLPRYLTELIRERQRAGDRTLPDFLNLFHHRLISLFYRAWQKYRFGVVYERGERDLLSHHLLDLIGLGTPGLQDRQRISDEVLMYYAGLLAQRPRSAIALEQMLEDHFDVPAKVVQFTGAWYAIGMSNRCRFDDRVRPASQLGLGAVIGREVWQRQSVVRIRLGPLTLDEYLDFLPTGTAFAPLQAMTRFFAGDTIQFEVQLILRRDEAPRCELGRRDSARPRLGWLAWARRRPLQHDPDETILQLSTTVHTAGRTHAGST